MPKATIVYWRDIPAQVIIGKGRRAVKLQLSPRFEEAIDRCAMRTGARDSSSYLDEWRRAAVDAPGSSDEIAARELADKLEQDFDAASLATLVAAGGWQQKGPPHDKKG